MKNLTRAVKPVVFLFFLHFASVSSAQDASEILLKNYRPVSIYKVPVTHVQRAAYPVIDAHSHDYSRNEREIEMG